MVKANLNEGLDREKLEPTVEAPQCVLCPQNGTGRSTMVFYIIKEDGVAHIGGYVCVCVCVCLPVLKVWGWREVKYVD